MRDVRDGTLQSMTARTFICAAALALITASAAAAAEPDRPEPLAHATGTDSRAHVNVTLAGRTLTVAMTAGSPRRVVRAVAGHRVRLRCGRGLAGPAVTGVTVRWPSRARRMTAELPADVSEIADVCVVTRGGRVRVLADVSTRPVAAG